MLLLRHLPSGAVVVPQVEEAANPLTRAVGLLGRRALVPEGGLWIHPCRSIHMLGMRFAVDAVFLDGRHRVVRVVPGLRPWRLVFPVRQARSVVELPAGRAAQLDLTAGDALRFEVVPGYAAP